MREHRLIGKLVIIGIIFFVPLAIFFSIKVATTYCTGDVCIRPDEQFLYKCEGNTCVYNLDYATNPITVTQSDTLYTVTGKCINMITTTYNNSQDCTNIKTFPKALWNLEEPQFHGTDLAVFQKKV